MNYIKNPNLPTKKVRYAIIDNRAGNYIKELEALGVTCILSKNVNSIDANIASHPDMQLCHMGTNSFVFLNSVLEYYTNTINKIAENNDCEKINNVLSLTECEKALYPDDCKLNTIITEKWQILHYKNNYFYNLTNRINVRQGYVKCSVCTVAENAIITSDSSIAKACTIAGIDVCNTTNDSIQLSGYDNGFIGGTCGKISKNAIAFYGDIKAHPDYDKITHFCKNYGVDCISLGKGNICDFGSIIPLFEE